MSKQQLKSEVTGSIWKIETAVGQALEEGHTVLIIESMKMEIPLVAEDGGTLVEILVAGDMGRNQSRAYMGNHIQGPPTSRRIALPRNWPAPNR